MTNKRIVSITTARNECDIIEEFVRYNCNILDEMYIIDSMSTDSTLDILLKLKDEGLPINIFRYNSYEINYPNNLNYLQRMIRKEKKADFIMVLDSDDFIYSKSKEELIQTLCENESLCYSIDEIKYSQLKENMCVNSPYHKRFNYYNTNPHGPKIILNVNLLGDKDVRINDGGHALIYENKGIKGSELLNSKIHLAHFSERSDKQIRSKYVMGIITYLMIDPNFVAENKRAYHWVRAYKKMIYNGAMKDIHATTVSQTDIDNNVYIYRKLPLTCTLKYTSEVNINPLKDCIKIFNSCIEYNKNEENTRYIIDFLDNIDINIDENEQILIEVVKKLEAYLKKNGYNIENNIDIVSI